ncbi:MAG: hypothetical protein J6B90_00715 [Lachnospiraceae bacterium]|nr:hypothetical protein [Lachnospiraceae bacterium]
MVRLSVGCKKLSDADPWETSALSKKTSRREGFELSVRYVSHGARARLQRNFLQSAEKSN